MIAGQNFLIQKNDEILKIKSPRNRLSGPYVVVTKDINNRWAIVALRWDNNRNGLGIRWFHGRGGKSVQSSINMAYYPRRTTRRSDKLITE